MIKLTLLEMKAEADFNRMLKSEQYHTVFHIVEGIVVRVHLSSNDAKFFMTDGHDSYFTRNISQASRALANALA